jgi:hypothetical protein
MNIQTGLSTNNVRVRYGALPPMPGQGQAAPSLRPQPSVPQAPGGDSGLGRFLDRISDGAVTVFTESGAVLENDPALAVREFATRVHELASRGYGPADLTAWAPYVGVGARTLILGANVMRAHTTFTTQGKGMLEKGLDVARIATDLAGVAGAVIRVALPSHAGLGTALMGIAQSADLVSHGARFGMHSGPRVRGWLKEHAEARAREKEREKKAQEAH